MMIEGGIKMNEQEKLQVIADILEVEVGDFSEDDLLEEFESWDSVAILSVISVISEQTGRFLHASEISKLSTVRDLLNLF